MSPIEHAPTETNGSIAAPETNDRFVVHTCTQALFFSLGTAAKLLDAALQPPALYRRHGRRRLRRQGRFAHRAALYPRRHADRAPRALRARPRGGDASTAARAGPSALHQGRRDARRPHRRAQGHELFRRRRLHAALQLRRGEVHRPCARTLHHPQCARRLLLRLHQPHPGHRHARLRHHRRRLRARSADGQAGAQGRHRPDGVPHPQRLPRRGHEGAPARGPQLRADRMCAGGGREGRLADPRRVPAHELAHRRRRRARCHPRHRHRRGRTDRHRPAGKHATAPRAGACRSRRPHACRSPCAAQPRVAPAARGRSPRRRRRAAAPRAARAAEAPRAPAPQHGATRFSSVFGTRRR